MTKRRVVQTNSHMIGELFTFALFGVFLLLSLLIVVIGVDGYKGVVQSSETTGAVRTSLGYVAGKVRSEASADGVRIEDLEGSPVLVLTENYEDMVFETYIFCRDGALYETFLSAGDVAFDPDFANRLIDIADFDIAWAQEGLLRLSATAADGHSESLRLAVRTATDEEAALHE